MKSKVILFAMIATIAFSACSFWGVRGNGRVKIQSRDVETFDRIDAGGAYSIYVVSGKSTALKISAEENLLQFIKTNVKGGTLFIESKKSLNPKKGIEIFITTPSLKYVDLSGANSVEIEGLNEKEFTVNLSGAGSVGIKGLTESLLAELSGAGSIDAKNLIARNVVISVSGAASADVFAKEALDASVSGVGSIDYYGNPSKTKTNVSGVGSISKK